MRFFIELSGLSIRGKRRLLAALPLTVLLWTTSVAQSASIAPGGGGGGSGPTNATTNPPTPEINGGIAVTQNQQFQQLLIGADPTGLIDTSSYTVSPSSGSSSLTFTYTGYEMLTAPATGLYTINTYVLGLFETSLFSGSDAEVVSYSVSSTLSTVSNSGGLGATLGFSEVDESYLRPLSSTPIPLSGSSASSAANLFGGTSYWMEQNLTVTLQNLSPSEQITFAFPNQSSIDPAPEPASLTLFGIGACVLMGYGWKRRKTDHRMP